MNKRLIYYILSLILILNFLNTVYAHPHPAMDITNFNNTISIRALHMQKLTEQYIKDNFILRDCDYKFVETYVARLETFITLKHDCNEIILEENTLFRDYWKSTPILINTKGIIEANETTGFIESVRNMKVPSNFIYIIPFLFILGIIFTLSGDFFSYILPISVSSKVKEDNKLWFKAWGIHLISTYFFIIFSLKFLSNYIIKFSGFVIVFIGGLMFLEKYLQRKHLSPYLLALIPCAGSIFVATVIFANNLFYMVLAPLVMNLGDLVLLKAGSKIPIPKKYVSKIPYFMFAIGFIVILKFSIISGSVGISGMNVLGSDKEFIVDENDLVTISYGGKFDDETTYGEIAWQSISFVVGSGDMIYGIDNATRGMKKGEVKEIFMTASEAYGEYDSSKIIEIPLSSIANKDKLIEGKYVGLQHGDSIIDVKIIEIKENSVLLDGNSLLAGKNLLYTVKIMDIEKR